jgi:hypothetical protein
MPGGLWQGFPDGALRLAELVYSREDGRCVRDVRVGSLVARKRALRRAQRDDCRHRNAGKRVLQHDD